jgi:uncharacterized repeat protein (TIGR01451 family)
MFSIRSFASVVVFLFLIITSTFGLSAFAAPSTFGTYPYSYCQYNTNGNDACFGLDITKSTNKSSAIPGDTLQYTINIHNVSQSTIYGIVVNDVLNNGLTFQSCSDSCSTGSLPTVTWNLASLGAGATKSFILTVQIKSDFLGTLSNEASVLSDTTLNRVSVAAITTVAASSPDLPRTGGLSLVFLLGGGAMVLGALAAAGFYIFKRSRPKVTLK